MAEQGKSYLLPVMAAAVFAGLARLVLRKRREDKLAAKGKAPRR